MTTTSAIGGAAASQTGSAASAASKQLAGNFDTFLTLLTAQLKNQDPLSPMDANQFTQQLVQFAGVEQSIQTNKNLESILGVQKTGQTANAVSYIGRQVTADSAEAALSDGRASWDYNLASPAQTTSLLVTDANNKVVAVAAGETAKGAHRFTWDGKDASGAQLPDGIYTLQIAATDSTGADVDVGQTLTGLVDGVDTSGEAPFLLMNGVSIPLAAIRGVQQASAS